jgi:membrane-associated protein
MRLVDFIHWLIDILRHPDILVKWGGYPGLAAIIFAETGAMIFFLPGDSLLVIAGVYAANDTLNIWYLNLLLGPLAVLGDACSYMIGKYIGPHLFNRPRSWLFRPEHLRAAHNFYEKHGGKAIIIARFIPIVRTFVPVVAGIGEMSYKRFAAFNVFGGLGWVASMTLIGYWLGRLFPSIPQHVEKVIIVVVAVSLLPGLVEYGKARLQARKSAPR